MPIITKYNEVKEIYDKARDIGVCLPVFAAEDRETVEAILAAGLEFGKQIGRAEIPIVITWTVRYPLRPQMTKLTACGNPYLSSSMMLSDLALFMDDFSPYHKLLLLPHLDHCIPWLDYDIINNLINNFASILIDASEKLFEENIKITTEFVKKFKSKIIIEGVVDSISESGEENKKSLKTSVNKACEFFQKTGVDIIVPNVGTVHRSTNSKIEYDSNLAKRISKRVGKLLSLHGTSSLNESDFKKLPDDGFIKINIFTILAVLGGQAVAENVLYNLGNIFNKNKLNEFIEEGILNKEYLSLISKNLSGQIKPKLKYLANEQRRNAWFQAIKNKCLYFFRLLDYEKIVK